MIRRHAARQVCWITAAVAILILLWRLPSELARLRDPYFGEQFDSAVWKREDRPRMVRDLMRNHLLPGLTRRDVRDLIGEPTHRDLCFSPKPGSTRLAACQRYDYQLSPVRPLRLDPDHLEVFFDDGGKLESVHLFPDPAW